jgi:phosphinothricin acetyltransferase
MNEEIELQDLSAADRTAVIDIFNDAIENSFAAYPEHPVSYEFFDMILHSVKGYPSATLRTPAGMVIGFGFLRPYHLIPAFRRTAEISYFIKPEYTGRGLGQRLLDHLLAGARQMEVDCIVASISSLNPPSLKFHRKHGFQECGRFLRVGRKKGTDFDVVWMQRLL